MMDVFGVLKQQQPTTEMSLSNQNWWYLPPEELGHDFHSSDIFAN